LGKQGELSGVEIFIFTDNSTAEAAFCRGSSSNQKLYGMIREVKAMEMLFETRVHVVHVAGKRMIAQGTDGLSRGCLADGVMEGKEMTSFVPLHLSAVTRSTSLMPWLQYGSGGRKEEILEVLTPEEWYEKGHDIAGGTPNCDGVWTPTYRYGNFVWSPPPCVAEQCLEELRRARHKRQRSTHVFVCPKIMSYASWQRQLFRSADVVIQIPAGHPAWITEQYESLIVGFYFLTSLMNRGNSKTPIPFWEWQGSCNVCAKQIRAPRDLFCENFGSSRGSFQTCQNAWCSECYKELDVIKFPRQLPENDEGFVWKKKRDESRFLHARKGEMLCAPFQCDYCWFINLKGREYDSKRAADRLNMSLIRRVNLDVFWDKETSTVEGMLQVFVRANTAAQHLGITPSFLRTKRYWPLGDDVGFGEAMLLLWDSVQPVQRTGNP
jgi:hypothetical protein